MIALLLALLAGPALADDRSAEAARLLEAGEPNGALAIWWGILETEPDRLDARDGVVRGLLALGDFEAAARAADERLALAPDDADGQWLRLHVLGLVPARRAEALVGLRAFVAAHPEDVDALADFALYLSWTPGNLDEAVLTWRKVEAIDPSDPRMRLGLARALAWSGANREARRRFDALLADDPKDFDALLGRAQLARWNGHPGTARRLLARAEDLRPDDPRLLAEHARLEADAGRRGVSRREARAAQAAAPGLYEAREALDALDALTAPRVGLEATLTDESTGVRRVDFALPAELYLLPDTRVRLEPSFSRFGAELDRLSFGAELRQGGLPAGLYGQAGYGFHQFLGGEALHEVALELGAVRPADLPLTVRLGARQRPLSDLPMSYEDLALLNVVGSGGATLAGIEAGLMAKEAWAGLVVAPVAGLYVHGEGTLGTVEDNGRRTVSAGFGQDLLRALPRRSAHAFTLRYDLYFLSLDAPDLRYFSPDTFLVHTPGAEWRWSGRWLTLGLEGGLPRRAGAPMGWLVGGVVGLRVGEHLELGLRGRTIDDTAWRATGATLALDGRF